MGRVLLLLSTERLLAAGFTGLRRRGDLGGGRRCQDQATLACLHCGWSVIQVCQALAAYPRSAYGNLPSSSRWKPGAGGEAR